MQGVTVLEREVSGKIVAAEIRDRLAGVIPADTFLTE